MSSGIFELEWDSLTLLRTGSQESVWQFGFNSLGTSVHSPQHASRVELSKGGSRPVVLPSLTGLPERSGPGVMRAQLVGPRASETQVEAEAESTRRMIDCCLIGADEPSVSHPYGWPKTAD